MKPKLFFLTLCVTVLNYFCLAQNDPVPIGYKLKTSQTLIRVYQDNGSNKPDLTKYNFWNHDYWFVVDEEEIAAEGASYVRVYIKSGLGNQKPKAAWPSNGLTVDSDDFNTFLYITQSDFNTYKIDEYKRYSGNFILSALTVPFKIRPKTRGHSSSLYNSNFNLGTLFGFRVSHKNKGGLSFGAMFGVSSQDQNSSTNAAITDESSQTMTAINYGGAAIFDLSKTFQLGLVVGWDHGFGDLAKTYIYHDHAWFAFSLNFKFIEIGKPTIQQKE